MDDKWLNYFLDQRIKEGLSPEAREFYNPEEQGFQPPNQGEQNPYTFDEFGFKGITPDKNQFWASILGDVPQGNPQQGFKAEQPVLPNTKQETPQDSQGITSQDLAAGARLALDEMKERANQQPTNLGGQDRINQLRQAGANALANSGGGGLLGKLAGLAINKVIGNWLSGVGSRAAGTVGDFARNKWRIKL